MTDVERLLAILEREGITNDAPVPLGPCYECGHTAVKRLGTQSMCVNHLGELYATFDPANIPPDAAFGYQVGSERPDWGLMYADLACCRCGAGWVGVPGEQCWWCRSGQEVLQDHQADLLLKVPEDGPDLERRIEAWAERLVVGVEAGIITAHQARNAGRAIDRSGAA